MVCQNQSIDDSEAPLAKDLRVLVREHLKAGDTDQQIRDFLVARYGNFVLLKPPVDSSTWVLWFGPFAVLVVSGLAIGLAARFRRASDPVVPLSEEEAAQLQTLLKSGPEHS